MVRSLLLPASLLLLSTALGACSAPAASDAEAGNDAITSNDARILDFTFKGEVIASSEVKARTAIVAQLAYSQGILTTAERGNGHVGQVTLTDVVESAAASGKKKITYTAQLPVAWPKDGNAVPTAYDLPLPKDVTALDAFNAKYDGKCGNNEYGVGDFWHDFNPKTEGCTLADADVTRSRATVKPFAGETTGKYPEYDLMWKDGELDVVAIFGLIDGGGDSDSDPGVGEYNRFIAGTQGMLTGSKSTKNAKTDSILRDTTLTGTVKVGGQKRAVKIDVLLVAEMKSVGSDFDKRYDPISEKADLIMYDGHAGLGKNVNALARKGKVTAGKYQLVLLNGCQTFAYIDTTMNDRRIEANGAAADPSGTKFMDVMGNALPGFASNLASMSLTLVGAAVKADEPRSFNQLMESMPQEHLVVVFGEEDNRFKP
ncbi:MAG TPA: hypothetical protein VLT33_13815 [Labilithrix sp.]|nr:hypothetical protein [Labilithrix sp.]